MNTFAKTWIKKYSDDKDNMFYYSVLVKVNGNEKKITGQTKAYSVYDAQVDIGRTIGDRYPAAIFRQLKISQTKNEI